MKKAGIIRCQKTEDMCQGRMDFKVAGECIKKRLGDKAEVFDWTH